MTTSSPEVHNDKSSVKAPARPLELFVRTGRAEGSFSGGGVTGGNHLRKGLLRRCRDP